MSNSDPVKRKAYDKQYYVDNKQYFEDYREKNKEKSSEQHKQWYLDNKDHRKQYLDDNKGNIKTVHAKYIRDREVWDLNFRLANRLRARLYKITKGLVKAGSAVKDLGCSITELKEHLEQQFQKGMTWDNYGEWHVDHIRAISKFDLTNRQQFLEACNYSNLQPLWAVSNIIKGNK
jgi:hypothetical protein